MLNKHKHILLILGLGVIAWLPVLNFWFFKAYEATWLEGLKPHTFINLIRSHSLLYFIDWRIFGWNPTGWYATSLVLHILASLLLYKLIYLITKNKTLSFISGIIFVANTSYNDVLTWGSFNSYYPLLLIWMLSGLISFYKYKKTNKVYFLFFSVIFSLFAFFTRETGIVIVPLIAVFDLIFTDKIGRKNILNIVKRQFPFLLALIVFFVIRSLYGGTPGDSADSNVKLQMKFISDKLYLEYAMTAFLTFGKLIPPQIIPYTFLNLIREYLSRFVYFGFMNTYFFSILGWIIFGFFAAAWYKLRKSKYSSFFLFFLIWLGAFSIFVSLAVPSTPEVLMRAYEYNTMRYRYFAFLGTSVLISIILVRFFSKRRLIAITLIVVLLNLFLIWNVEKEVYVSSYSPAKEFYAKFISYFPTLPKNVVFYLYPNTSGLSDYLLEWYLIKESSYPNLLGQPLRVESQIIAVIDKLRQGKINLSDVIFLDYNQKYGLLNKTSEVRKILTNEKSYLLNFSSNDNVFNANLDNSPLVEFPYDIKLTVSASAKPSYVGETPDSNRFKALADYEADRESFFDTVNISTAYTASQRAGEPFYHTLPSFLIDGNTGPRSKWIADTFSPWIVADLGEERSVAGISWGSLPGSTRSPATYAIFSSNDGRTWNRILFIKNTQKWESLDVFPATVKTRYLKMEIYTTSGGDFVLIDEFEVIGEKARRIFDLYSDRSKLLTDSNNIFNFVSSKDDLDYAQNIGLTKVWAKLTWETDATSSSQNAQYWYFPVKLMPGVQNITIPLIEGEIYAGEGQFLKKHITSISLDFTSLPYIIEINSSGLVPREKFK